MPQTKSCKKRLRQSKKAREKNRKDRSRLRTEIKKIRNETEKKTAEKQLPVVFSVLDKLCKKNVIHKNKVANQKSKLTKFVQKLT